jgi:LmbE family N-acetylglucosaminyl deacetylase
VGAKTILVVLSHPDDELGCAGTIARHADQGDRVVLTWLTRGGMTEALGDLSVAEVERRRTEHGVAAARILGCEARFLDFPDTRVEVTHAAVVEVAHLIAEVRPDAVLTWGEAWVRGIRHPDHRATGQIARDAVTLARLTRVVAPLAPHREPAPIFTLRDVHSTLPPRAVDVTPVIDRIEDLARLYREEIGWPAEDWLRNVLESAGREWGVEAAEVFDAWETPPGLGSGLV